MKVGRAVRTRLGRFEAPVSNRYRAWFVDLEECARIIAGTVEASSILEVGCGDGQFAGHLLERFPRATYTGIDVAPEVGRLFRGDRERATFRSLPSRALLDEGPEPFDLVVVVDVLHHVPEGARSHLLDDVRQLTAPGGHYAVKDWVRSWSLAHAACWASDRLLTGDRVSYFGDGELGSLIRSGAPRDEEVLAASVGPRRNNDFHVYRRDDS